MVRSGLLRIALVGCIVASFTASWLRSSQVKQVAMSVSSGESVDVKSLKFD